jgi:anti-anti-sigma regulatory factor
MSILPLTAHRPASALISSVLRGREAMITVTGTVDRRAAGQISTLLRGLCDAGAAQVFLDLAWVSSCDRSLAGLLGLQRRRLEASGGWLIVDGSPATLGDDLAASLDEAFRAYREVRARAVAGPGSRP